MDTKLLKRKLLRLKNYDYSTLGAYFVTFCTEGNKHILSSVEKGSDDLPTVKLSGLGEIVDAVINNVPTHLNVDIDAYIIMPNHVHILMILNGDQLTENGKRSVVSKMIGFIKMQASKKIREAYGKTEVWQRGYNDHIIRDEKDYENVKSYIYYNPLRWLYKE